MTKEVLIKIKGLQFAGEEDADAVEVITSGTYYKKNGKHYVLYEEVNEDSRDVTKNVIKIGTNIMEVTRKGPASVHMMFEEGKQTVSYYYTPFGNLLIGIDAKSVSVEESENEIVARVKYGLDINYDHVAECNITVRVLSKEVRDFKL